MLSRWLDRMGILLNFFVKTWDIIKADVVDVVHDIFKGNFSFKNLWEKIRVKEEVSHTYQALWHNTIPVSYSLLAWRCLKGYLPVDSRLWRKGFGGIIRNQHGNPLDAFAAPLDFCSIVSAKLMSLSFCLERCLNLGYHHVNFEVDSKTVIHAISENIIGNPNEFYTIRKIRMMLGEMSYKISHIYREGNVCADWLAKTDAQSICFQEFSIRDFPSPLKGMVSLDKAGLPYFCHD
ncbi:uncharacterized protein LOC114581388 isoform X2 [Dendrobium catenatum]|uniref:uncharacterized protein LOC114581388 isoform X2 n=1 Tax=Dendrobium catenatum TaxID=906689 RepID=UPI00109F3200|nr:uncharacterized protein LOC114581388 isoform X2 [Dendrobium catenatum]